MSIIIISLIEDDIPASGRITANISVSSNVNSVFRSRKNISASINVTSNLIAQNVREINHARIIADIPVSTRFLSQTRSLYGQYQIRVKSSLQANLKGKLTYGEKLTFLVDMVPEVFSSSYQQYRCRFLRNGVEYPVKKFSVRYPGGSIGNNVEIHLARPSDYSTFVYSAGATYKFDIGIVKNSATTWHEIVNSEKLESKNFDISWSGGPKDGLKINTVSDVDQKLTASPDRTMILYDINKVDINESELKPLKDTEGLDYSPIKLPHNPLTFYSLMQLIAKTSGFSDWDTNIEDFELQGRIDIPITGSYLDAIRGILGTFKPLITIIDGVLWILDTTIMFPEGFPAPGVITSDNYQRINKSSNLNRIDAFVVTYLENATEGGLFIETIEQTDDEQGDYGDVGWTNTETETTIRKYYRAEEPNVYTKEVIRRVKTTVYQQSVANVIQENIEDFFYDFQARLTSSKKTYRMLVPDLSAGGVLTLTTIREEDESITYGPHPYYPNRQIQLKRRVTAKGLKSIDSTNLYFDEDFEQDLSRAHEAGNLKDGMTSLWAPLWRITEDTRPVGNNQVKTYIQKIDLVRKIVTNTISTNRVGDNSMSSLITVSKEIVVKAPGFVGRPINKQTFNIGPVPTSIGIPLVRRLLEKNNNRNSNINFTYIGFDPYIKVGTVQQCIGRESLILGNYMVEDLGIEGDNMGNPFEQTVLSTISGPEV